MSVTCIPQFATYLDAELCSVAQHLQARPLITGPKGSMTAVVAVTLGVCLFCNCLLSVKVDTRYRKTSVASMSAHCNAGYQGAAVYAYLNSSSNLTAQLTVRDCTMENNLARNISESNLTYGGALYASSGLTSVTLDSLVMNNNSARQGGAVYLVGALDVSITNCSFASNSGTVL